MGTSRPSFANVRPARLQIVAPLSVRRSIQKFLRFFPKGFRDQTYLEWERNYKWNAHRQWDDALTAERYRAKLSEGKFLEIAAEAVRIESRTNLLFSFEKMALRDALKSQHGARLFSEGLYQFLHGDGNLQDRYEGWCETVAALPRTQSRVLTWPVVTVFGFIAQPNTHIFLKPTVTRIAAREYGFDFQYRPRPSWATYANFLEFADRVRRDLRDLRPRDMIDIQSFMWILGSDEYAE